MMTREKNGNDKKNWSNKKTSKQQKMLTIVKHVDTCLYLTELISDIGELKQI